MNDSNWIKTYDYGEHAEYLTFDMIDRWYEHVTFNGKPILPFIKFIHDENIGLSSYYYDTSDYVFSVEDDSLQLCTHDGKVDFGVMLVIPMIYGVYEDCIDNIRLRATSVKVHQKLDEIGAYTNMIGIDIDNDKTGSKAEYAYRTADVSIETVFDGELKYVKITVIPTPDTTNEHIYPWPMAVK